MKFYGYEFEVSVYAYFKVAMDKRTKKEDIEEEAFAATSRLFNNMSKVTVVDSQLMKYSHKGYFTIADFGLDLRIKVTEHNYEAAFREAEKIVRDIEVPVGVSFFECEAYCYEQDTEKVVGE